MSKLQGAPKNTDSHIRPQSAEKVRPHLSGATRALFGKENLERLLDLMMKGPICDLDQLIESQEMTRDEAHRYAQLMPDIAACIDEAYQVAIAMVSYMQPSLARRVRIQRIGGTNEGNINYLIQRIAEMSGSIARGLGCWAQGVFSAFQFSFCGLLLATIKNSLSTPEDHAFFDTYCTQLNALHRQKGALEFPGMSFYLVEYQHSKHTLNNTQYQARLKQMLGATGELSSARKSALQGRIAKKLEWIHHLREYRKVLANTQRIGECSITTYRDDFEQVAGNNPAAICHCQISLSANEVFTLPTVQIDKDSKITLVSKPRPGVLSVAINRKGDILFCANLATSYEALLGEEMYILLRLKILEQLEAYLGNKPEDIIDPLLRIMIPSSRIEVATILPPTVEDESPAIEIPPATHDTPAQLISKIREKTPRLKRSIKTSVVLRAIKKLLGEPIRICGSHYIFRGLNGNTSPIALHNGEVSTKMLAGCLTAWNISVEDFTKAL